MPPVKIPTIRTERENPTPISPHRRIALIHKAMTDDNLTLMERVAATLALLYAQPCMLSRSAVSSGSPSTMS